MLLPGLAPLVFEEKRRVTKLRRWPSNLNNNGFRLILPHTSFLNRALALDVLTVYTRIALSRGTSSQFTQTPPARYNFPEAATQPPSGRQGSEWFPRAAAGQPTSASCP
eukprot:7987062-Pyramimonas_sp.AAC.1